MAVEFKMKKIKVPKALKSVRYSLLTVNSLFLATGLVLVITGAVILAQHQVYRELITQRFFTLPGFVIGTGVVIILTSILGFYAAISEQFYYIIGYLVLLVSVLIFEIAITITGYELRADATEEIQSTMVQSLQQYSSKIEVAKLWDDMQMGFQCCGAVNTEDYAAAHIPVSCCYIDYGTVSPFICTSDKTYTPGCAGALGAWLGQKVFIIAVIALVVTVVQIVLTSLAAWLAWRSKFEEVELER